MEDLDEPDDHSVDVRGEVQRHASTSAAKGADAATGEDQKSKKRKRPQVVVSTTGLEVYSKHLETHARDLEDRLKGTDRRWLKGAQGERIASDQWSAEDLTIFFLSLARRSRLRPDLIAEDLDGRKTVVQVSAYLGQLSHAARSVPPTTASAVREVSDKWIEQEEKLAGQLQNAPNDSTTYDRKVCNAVWFLHSRVGFIPAQESSSVTISDEGSIRAFRLADLAAEMQIARTGRGRRQGESRQIYRIFGESHPLPILTGGEEHKQGRPRKVKRRKVENGKAGSQNDQHKETSAHRVLLRAIELGLLLVVRGNTLPALTRRKAIIEHNGHPLSSTQSDPLPTELLDEIKVVFATAVPDSVKSSKLSLLRAGTARMQEASQGCLDRILSSVTHEELRWLEGNTAPAISQPGAQPHPTTISSTQAPHAAHTKGRGRTTDTYRGHSLTGMDAIERERFKARIRAREAKYGAEATRQSPPTTPISSRHKWQGVHGDLREPFNESKYAVLEEFEEELSALSHAERKKMESKLRARIRAWGPEKTLRVGFGSSRDARSVTVDTEEDSGRVDGSSETAADAESTLAEPEEDERMPPETAPGPDSSRKGARFLAIGKTRTEVWDHLKQNSGGIFDLNALGAYLSASVMTSCTRPDEFDSLVDQEVPLRFNLLETLVRLQEELRSFVASVLRDVVVEVESGSGDACTVDRSLMCKVLSGRNKLSDDTNTTEANQDLESHSPASAPWIEEDLDSDDESEVETAASLHRPLRALFLNDRIPSSPLSSSDEFTPIDSEDEVFESHYEAAQVDSVRRLWGRGVRAGTSITDGFFWPDSSRSRASAEVDLGDVVDSSEEERESEQEVEEEAEEDGDDDGDDDGSDDAASVLEWEDVDRRDQEEDRRYERRAWSMWFGTTDAEEVLQVGEDGERMGEEASDED